jgi:hypothetical protein
MVRMRAEFLVLLEGTDAICTQSNHVYASSCVFKLFKKIEKPAACEMRFVILFLNASNMKPSDIHLQFCDVYGEHAMIDSTVRSHRGRDMSVAHSPSIEAAVHGIEAHIIANKENIQTDHFN